MKLLVLGATGPTGQHIVRQALDLGHEVTAFVRDPAKLPVAAPSLEVLTDGPRTARYRVGERLALRGMPKIARADVADFALRQLTDPAWVGKCAVISD